MPLFYVISHYFNLPFRAWEQRKLGEIAKITMGQSPDGINYTDNPKYNILVQGNADMKNGQVVPRVWTKQITKTAKKGDIILSVRAPVGEVGKTKYNVVLGRGVSGVEGNEFVFQLLSKMKLENYWGKYSAGSTFESIKSNEIKAAIASVPEKQEQMKIGTFLKQLDDTIALHQRKLDALKLLKKGFLQQMVTKSGENIPKIRFDDFDDIWEQRILGEFLKESKIKGSNGSLAKKLTVKLWRKGVVPKEEIYTGSSATQYYIRKTGQFMYGKLDFLNQAFGIVPLELNGYESTLDSPAFDIEDSLNETFLLEYVSLARFYKYQGNIANGSRRAKRIHTDTFFEMPIPLPNSNEQQKIGTFSQQIDDLITLQQNKLEKLSSLKRFYLKNMFI
ncbi:restriction endonuclease subunit S [Listeria innocua]|uniref:restriction endonuclease subunit S n=1 Tax=Listeria innocua TaxID=1642 RepID=UPI001C896C9E|nr:restriction endonuclease subunit S [Listeria innocua]